MGEIKQKKRMGRPPTETEPVMVRMTPQMIRALDDLRRTLDGVPTRPEMIRRLVDRGLKAACEKSSE